MVCLVHISHLDGLSDFKGPGIRFFLTHYQTEQRSLASSIRAYDTYNAVGRQREIKVFKKLLRAERLGYAVGFDDLVAQTWAVWYEYLQLLLTRLLVLVEQTVVAVETRLALGLTRFRRHTHPLKLTLEGLRRLLACFSS